MARRRSGGCGIAVLIVLLVLALGVVVADRALDKYAEGRVASQLTGIFRSDTEPAVDITGIPFLTQYAGGTFDLITVAGGAAELAYEQRTLAVNRYDLDLTTVTDSGDGYRVGQLDGDVELSYAGLSELAGIPIGYGGTTDDGRGQLRVQLGAEVYGRTGEVIATGVPSIDPATQQLELDDVVVDIDGTPVPVNLARFGVRLPTLQLPNGLQAESLTVTESGAVVAITGTDVTV